MIESNNESELQEIVRMGLQSEQLTLKRVGDSDVQACVTAGLEVLEQEVGLE